jgi:hypothetical protein
MSDTPKKKALILTSFTDSGTGESFEAGATPMISVGTFSNYEAAGLVGTPLPAKPKPVTKPKVKATPKAAPRAPSPVPSAPAPPANASEAPADA